MINVALLGFGLAGRVFHAPLISACEGLRLHTVVSSQREALAVAWPEARVLADAEQVFADPAVDLVVVATPNDTHARLARAALEAGKAVVVDKPFTLTVAEARELAALAADRGLLLSVFHNRRWDADFLAVKQLIAERRLGRVVRFESRFDRFRPEVRDRWKDTAPGTGAWCDLGPHLIDQALQLFGRPLAVTCDLVVHRTGGVTPDGAHALLRYEGLRVILHADALAAASDLRFAVHGDRASFIKEGLDAQEGQLAAGLRPGAAGFGEDPRPGVIVEGASGERSVFRSPPGDYGRYYAGVAAALRGEGANPVPPDDGVDVMEVIEAGIRSNAERREIAL